MKKNLSGFTQTDFFIGELFKWIYLYKTIFITCEVVLVSTFTM